MKITIRLLLLIACALATTACTSYDRAWSMWRPEHTRPQGTILGLPPRTIAQSPWDGRWSGRWTSSRHRTITGKPAGGKLRLVLTKRDRYKYNAYVRANWKIFKTDYEVQLDAQERGNVLLLRGVENRGTLIGGPYRYDGRVTPTRFTMEYDSRYDTGTIELTRP